MKFTSRSNIGVAALVGICVLQTACISTSNKLPPLAYAKLTEQDIPKIDSEFQKAGEGMFMAARMLPFKASINEIAQSTGLRLKGTPEGNIAGVLLRNGQTIRHFEWESGKDFRIEGNFIVVKHAPIVKSSSVELNLNPLAWLLFGDTPLLTTDSFRMNRFALSPSGQVISIYRQSMAGTTFLIIPLYVAKNDYLIFPKKDGD